MARQRVCVPACSRMRACLLACVHACVRVDHLIYARVHALVLFIHFLQHAQHLASKPHLCTVSRSSGQIRRCHRILARIPGDGCCGSRLRVGNGELRADAANDAQRAKRVLLLHGDGNVAIDHLGERAHLDCLRLDADLALKLDGRELATDLRLHATGGACVPFFG